MVWIFVRLVSMRLYQYGEKVKLSQQQRAQIRQSSVFSVTEKESPVKKGRRKQGFKLDSEMSVGKSVDKREMSDAEFHLIVKLSESVALMLGKRTLIIKSYEPGAYLRFEEHSQSFGSYRRYVIIEYKDQATSQVLVDAYSRMSIFFSTERAGERKFLDRFEEEVAKGSFTPKYKIHQSSGQKKMEQAVVAP